MGYCFRIRFRLGDHVKLDTDATELVLADEGSGSGETVELKQPVQGETLGEARHLVLRGGTYESGSEAQAAAERWKSYLQAALARLNLGADFGERAAHAAFTEYGLQMLSAEHGIRALNDVHGIAVFGCEPKPTFVAQEFGMVVGKPAHRLVEAVQAARRIGLTRTAVEKLAYDLYSASFFQPSADARFVSLMMALETLLVREPRSEKATQHVSDMIALTKSADLAEGDSIVGALRDLRLESIVQAGRRVADGLSPRVYMDETPQRFFSRCYALRSRLVHGGYPRPSREEVGLRAASLETFVSDLLSGELLELVPDWKPNVEQEYPQIRDIT